MTHRRPAASGWTLAFAGCLTALVVTSALAQVPPEPIPPPSEIDCEGAPTITPMGPALPGYPGWRLPGCNVDSEDFYQNFLNANGLLLIDKECLTSQPWWCTLLKHAFNTWRARQLTIACCPDSPACGPEIPLNPAAWCAAMKDWVKEMACLKGYCKAFVASAGCGKMLGPKLSEPSFPSDFDIPNAPHTLVKELIKEWLNAAKAQNATGLNSYLLAEEGGFRDCFEGWLGDALDGDCENPDSLCHDMILEIMQSVSPELFELPQEPNPDGEDDKGSDDDDCSGCTKPCPGPETVDPIDLGRGSKILRYNRGDQPFRTIDGRVLTQWESDFIRSLQAGTPDWSLIPRRTAAADRPPVSSGQHRAKEQVGRADRAYTTSPTRLTSGILGHNHQGHAFTYLNQGTEGSIDVVKLRGMFATRTFRSSDGLMFRSPGPDDDAGPDSDYMEPMFITIWGQDRAVFRHVKEDGTEDFYLREWPTPGWQGEYYVHATPEHWVGLKVREFDGHCVRVDYDYKDFGEGTEAVPRLMRQVHQIALWALEPYTFMDRTFYWNITEAPFGTLRWEETSRVGGDGVLHPVQKIKYKYFESDYTGLGAIGDLRQVRVEDFLDDGSIRVRITQYRYHTGENEVTSNYDSDQDGYLEQGNDHQLKMVIEPSAFEFLVENGVGYESVDDAAFALMSMDDGEIITLANSTPITLLELASKFVTRYELTDKERVLEQYVFQACECSSGGSAGRRLQYEYWDYPSPSGDDVSETVRITEHVWLGTEAGDLITVSYNDLTRFGDSDGPASGVNLAIYPADPLAEPEVEPWVTHFEYYPINHLVRIECTPSACASYTPGEPAKGTDPAARPEYQASTSQGLVYAYEYNDWKQRSLSMVGEGDRTIHLPVLSNENFTLVELRSYNAPDADEVPERRSLPTTIKRYRTSALRGAIASISVDDIEETTIEYGFWNETSARLSWMSVFVEAESASENGPGGDPFKTVTLFDQVGRPVLRRDATALVTETQYNEISGAVVRTTIGPESPQPDVVAHPYDEDFETWANTYGPDPLVTMYEYNDKGQQSCVVAPDDVKTCHFYGSSPASSGSVLNRLMVTTVTFAGEGEDLEFAGPATRTWFDSEGRELRRSQFAIEAGASYDSDNRVLTGLELGNEVWRSEVDRTRGGEVTARRDYLDLPASTTYAEWSYERDPLGRIEYQVDPDLTFTHFGYDFFGRVTETRTGVVGTGGYGPEYLVSKFVYDGTDATSGEPTPGVGNGRVTHVLSYVGPTDEDFRLTRNHYDYRGRVVGVENAAPPHPFIVFDNQDRITAEATFADLPSNFAPSSILTATDRGSYTEHKYNQRGLRYSTRSKIDPTTAISGSDPAGDFLQSDWWFDAAGRVRASRTPDAPGVKLDLDLFGRVRKQFVTDNYGDSLPGGSSNHAHALSVSDDHVLEETVNAYANNGRLQFVTSLRRTHWAEPSGTDYDGDLDDSGSNWDVRSYVGLWHDSLGRVTRTVDFGTNDSEFKTNTSAPTWPPSSVPNWSDSAYSNAQVRATEFNDRGWVSATVDPRGKRTELRYDAAGRRIAVIENADPSHPIELEWSTNSGGRWSVVDGLDASEPDINRTTTYVHDTSGRVIREAAHFMFFDVASTSPTYVSAVEVTGYEYGVEASSGGSLISSNRLLAATHYPNETTGERDEDDEYTVSLQYNRQGEVIARTDQNGTEHEYTRDELGRVTRDDVATFGSGIDTEVAAIESMFDDFGRLSSVKSFTGTAGSTLRDEVLFGFTPLGRIETVTQNHDGPATGTGSSAARTVTYAYRTDGMGDGNSGRATTLTYPDSTTYHFQYGASASLNDRISRLSKASVGSTSGAIAFEWKYLGLAAPVVTTLTEPFVELDRVRARDGDTDVGHYPALDRFGRVIQHRWVDGEFTEHSTQSGYSTIPPIVDMDYTYDASSNILTRYDARVGARRTDRHEEFAIDGLNRVTEAKRGTRFSSSSFSYVTSSQKWLLDGLGNWEWVKTNPNSGGTYATTETRVHNLANEIDDLDPDGTGSTNPYALAYDDAGNLLTRQISHSGSGTTLSYVHDAWNRLVEVQSNSVTRTRLRYNGLNWLSRRISDFKNSSNVTVADGTLDQVRVYSYGADWRLLEQRIYDSFDAGTGAYGNESRRALLFQGIGGIDDHLLRQEEQIPSGGGSSTFKRHYLLRDAGRSIIAIVNDTGVLEQRVRYDSYGNGRHRWRQDVDGDGDIDATDRAIVSGALNKRLYQTGYIVDADFNRDGIVNSTDLGQVTTSDYRAALQSGFISELYTSAATGAVDNDIGYSGYEFIPELALYHVRHRCFDPLLGRWLEHDPIGYTDGMNIYAYVGGQPIIAFDPLGLADVTALDVLVQFGKTWWGDVDGLTLAPNQVGIGIGVMHDQATTALSQKMNAASALVNHGEAGTSFFDPYKVLVGVGETTGTLAIVEGASDIKIDTGEAFEDTCERLSRTLIGTGQTMLFATGPLASGFQASGGSLAPAAAAEAIAARSAGAATGAEAATAALGGGIVRGGAGPVLKGQAGVARAIAEIEAQGGSVLAREVTVAVGGVRTRIDLLARIGQNLTFVEVKNGLQAALSFNQRAAFPLIRTGGGVPRGANAAAGGLQVGAPLPPTPVQVFWYP